MASLIKNQVLKHLTKFFKDLAPEQLQLSAFKGSCELSNLQLEEKVLMDLLSFPSWVKINMATCDQISLKIPWTKIKSVPIQMNLNQVTVEVEICEEFRDDDNSDQVPQDESAANLSNILNAQGAPGKYGFVDRVIDGITVTVNGVQISFKSKLMSATFNLSRVLIESRCPNWKPGELSLTRIKDLTRGQILLFKVVEWQTMRLEAKSLTDPNLTPLRLITNYAQCRLTIKKQLDDCSVLAARISVIFEDILWVVTFAQFVSAASFVEYVFTLIKRSPVTKKTTPFDDQPSVSSQSNSSMTSSNFSVPQTAPLISPMNTPVHSARGDRVPILTGNMSSASLNEQKFLCYDLVETSLHLYIDKLDAHLYDDIEVNSGSSSRDPGGALQTTLDQIQVDCYPYSRAMTDRKHWYRWFDPSPTSRKQWFSSHFAEFDLMQLQKLQDNLGPNEPKPSLSNSTATNESLLSLTVLIKVKDYCMNCVTTKQSMRSGILNKFIQTDKDYYMPADMPSLYLELNYFYMFDATNRLMIYDNVPNPLAFMHLSPTKLLFDSPTLVFLNTFQMNLSKALVHLEDLFPEDTVAPKLHCRIEILMPQVSLPAKANIPVPNSSTTKDMKTGGQQQQVPTSTPTSALLVKSGKITLCNSIYDKNILAKMMESIDKIRESPCQPINLSGGGTQPSNTSSRRENSSTDDWTKIWNASIINRMSEFSAHNQLWSIQFEPVWMDFMNYDLDEISSGQRLEPIVEPFNAYAFIHLNLSSRRRGSSSSRKPSSGPVHKISNQEKVSDIEATPRLNRGLLASSMFTNSSNKHDIISILVTVIDNSILANMDRIQFSFLQRLGMHVEKLLQQIKEDASSIIQMDTVIENTLELNLTAYIKDIRARLILDRRVDMQSVLMNDSYHSDKFENSLEIEIPPPSVIVGPDSGDMQSPFTGGNKSSPRQMSNLFGMESIIGNSFAEKPLIQEEKILGVVDPLANEPSTTEVDFGDLDECVEVADDASCLLMGDNMSLSSAASKITSNNEQVPRSGGIALGEESSAQTETSQRATKDNPGLLIDLDDVETTSSLFAKVNLNPLNSNSDKKQSEHNKANRDKISRQSTDGRPKLDVDETPTQLPQPVQTQEIETESISYLELSMSKLMVRRITETKRRQKF